MPVAKSHIRLDVPCIVTPAEAGIQFFAFRETRSWAPAFAGVTGRESVIAFGNGYM